MQLSHDNNSKVSLLKEIEYTITFAMNLKELTTNAIMNGHWIKDFLLKNNILIMDF